MKKAQDFRTEVAALRKIYDKLKAKKEHIESLIEQREIYFEEKSEKWQTSDTGINYEGDTSELQDRCDEFDIELDKLDECITEIYELSN